MFSKTKTLLMAAILKLFKIKCRYFLNSKIMYLSTSVPNFMKISRSVHKINVFIFFLIKKIKIIIMVARQKTKLFWNFSSNFDVRNHALDAWNPFSIHPVHTQVTHSPLLHCTGAGDVVYGDARSI